MNVDMKINTKIDITNYEVGYKLRKIFQCVNIDIFNTYPFEIIKNNDLEFERISWIGYLVGVILASNYEYSRSASYGKVLLKDKLGYFRDWFRDYFPLSRDSGRSVPFLTFYMQNQVLGFFKRNYQKNIEYITFDSYNLKSTFGERYLYAKKAFDAYVRNVFGNSEEVFSLYEKYFNIGNKLIPINYDVETCYNTFNSKKSIKDIIKYFENRGLKINNYGAERLKSILLGLEQDNRIYRNPVYINSSVFSNTDKFICCFEIKKKVSFSRVISTNRKISVLEDYNFHIFNYGQSVLDSNDYNL